jgi:hypothetical protein
MTQPTRRSGWRVPRRGQMDTDLNTLANSAAGASNDVLRAKLTDDGLASIKGAVAGGWLDPETGDKLATEFQVPGAGSAGAQADERSDQCEDGEAAHDVAARLSDPQSFRACCRSAARSCRGRLEALGYRLDQRAATRTAHADAVADRNLRKAQGS